MMKGDIMSELMEMYAGIAKVSAEKAKVKLQQEMTKSLNASQMADSFMDFYDRLLAKDPSTPMDEALKSFKEIINGLK